MEPKIRQRQLNEKIMHAVNRARTMEVDGEPADRAIIVTDKALSGILGVSQNTIVTWKKLNILVNYRKQSDRIFIYKLDEVVKDLERFIK